MTIIAGLGGLIWLDCQSAIAGAWLFPLAMLLAALASEEMLELARCTGLRPLAWTVYGGNLLIVAASWLGPFVVSATGSTHLPPSAAHWALMMLGLSVLAVFLGEMQRYRTPGGVTANLAAATFALVYVGLLLATLVMLRVSWGVGALISMVIVVKMGDTGAYTLGRLIGRHKLAPTLSPGKTIEGAFGALLFAAFGSWIAFQWIVPCTTPESVAPGPDWGWLAYGLVVGVAGMVGDLAESLLKRDARCKDSSRWMPGFGGVLDIIDSLLLAAPVAYACWVFGLVGR
jgi:phosphatidate cytidylyltransferase